MSTLPTLLIVDDEVRGLEALKRILEDDFNIRTATNVKEAETILELEWIQLLLCDQRIMPGTTGVQFLTCVRTEMPGP